MLGCQRLYNIGPSNRSCAIRLEYQPSLSQKLKDHYNVEYADDFDLAHHFVR